MVKKPDLGICKIEVWVPTKAGKGNFEEIVLREQYKFITFMHKIKFVYKIHAL